jgi:cyclopropane-fatty-acyl-phospholipid synthase
MLEHVGPEHFGQLGRVIQQCLSPQGRGLIHSIGQNEARPLNPWIEHRIFPGAEPPSLEQMMTIFPAGDLTVYDVENLRLHYAETLWHWLDRFERCIAKIRDRYSAEFIRIWRMYLATSYSSFKTGGLQLYQAVFAPTGSNHCSRSRGDLYALGTAGSTSLKGE